MHWFGLVSIGLKHVWLFPLNFVLLHVVTDIVQVHWVIHMQPQASCHQGPDTCPRLPRGEITSQLLVDDSSGSVFGHPAEVTTAGVSIAVPQSNASDGI